MQKERIPLAKQAKILSFDEAKRTSRGARPSVSASGGRQRASSSANAPTRRSKGGQAKSAEQGRSAYGKASATGGGASAASRGARGKASAAGASAAAPASAVSHSRGGTARGTAAFADTARGTAAQGKGTARAGARSGAAHAGGTRHGAASSASRTASEPPAKRPSKWEKFKRERAKSKVDRTFARQYGDQTSAASSGPRAALYKGEMGASHKRAARMQNAGGDAGASQRRFSAGHALAALSPRMAVSLACVACLVLTCVFLYPTAKQCYVTMRECDRLQAEYEAIENRNAAIQAEVDALSTQEGVEDRAREELGWVKTGEHAVTVYGIDVSEDDAAFSANIVPGSIEAPETWYSQWLDPLFGVE